MSTKQDELIGAKIKAVPAPQPEIGVDLDNTLPEIILDDVNQQSTTDLSALENFLTVSQSREKIYALIDQMSQNNMISAVLETYAEDVCETNEHGQIMWAESSDPNLAKYVQFLLDSINVDKHIYSWVYSLIKYGDVYLKLFRKSDYEEKLFDKDEIDKRDKLNESLSTSAEETKDPEEALVKEDLLTHEGESLKEDVVLKLSSKKDHYAHYMEKVTNPGEMFELTRMGKVQGYIQAPTTVTPLVPQEENIVNDWYSYKFKNTDVQLYEATDFVHACLENNSNRTNETVNIVTKNNKKGIDYNVRRGTSILSDIFRVWRIIELLENSIVLNRLTKSSIVRAIQVEVGGMPKEQITKTLTKLKGMVEQKSALNKNKQMSEYTNPGPIENNIYIPTKDGKGAITMSSIGGEGADVKSLADLEYFKNELYGSLRVPKQFFGQTDDAAGFNGGTSLAIISSRYGKAVKSIQNSIIQALTDAINLMLIDKGRGKDVNRFVLKMQTPTTQEEIDRREASSNQIRNIDDLTRIINDNVEDEIVKLKVLQSLLSTLNLNGEVTTILEKYISSLEEGNEKNEVKDEETIKEPAESTSGPSHIDTTEETGTEEIPTEEETPEEEEDTLPTPEEAMGEDEGEFEESLELPTFEALGVNGLGE